MRNTIAFGLALFAFGCIFFHIIGCTTTTEKHIAAQAAYLTERLHCVEAAPKPADDDERKASWTFLESCWDGVDKRFGVVSVGRDGGK